MRRLKALWRKRSSAPAAQTDAVQDVLAALARERALLASVMETTDVMLVYLDPDFNFVWVNPAYASTCQMNAADMVGRNHFDLYPNAENEAIFRRVRDTGEAAFYKDKPFVFPDQPERGTTYWDWSLSPHHSADGTMSGLVFSLRETTPYVRAQQAASENAEMLRLFIENAPAGIAMFDREMRFVAVSRRFLEDFDLGGTSVIGRGHYDVFPEIPERWREVHRRCLAGESLQCEEDCFERADGRVVWGRWKVRPWRTAAGDIGGIVLFTEDITARKQTEQALLASITEVKRANNAKSRFLGSISHDLRQPMCAISLYIDTLEKRLPAGDPLAANLKACVGSMGGILSMLLDLSKLDAGIVTPVIDDFDADEFMARVLAMHAPAAELKGLSLRLRRFGSRARTDPVLFRHIVDNLVANAIRYTKAGGVLIAPRRRGGKWWIEVWDTGIGIPSDRTADIFEEFLQLDNDERNAEKGVGLGLAIVAKTAALLGLAVRVDSRLGRGAMFAVEMPRA